jgi:hypothetical protein
MHNPTTARDIMMRDLVAAELAAGRHQNALYLQHVLEEHTEMRARIAKLEDERTALVRQNGKLLSAASVARRNLDYALEQSD